MSTIITNLFSINGVVDTSKNVMDNMNTLAAACSSWITFDIHTGKWSVVVNEAGSSIASFTDSNIIGGITVSGSGITELYNKVQLSFPHKDLNDQIDTITYEIPSEDRYPYEYDNVLNFQFDCINDPVQAEYLAALQLKQSRVDKVIRFKTDFTKLGLKAGDLIDVTSTMYGYTNKVFRILSISEEDADDYSIGVSITAFEYDSGVYSTSGLIRTSRTIQNGIVSTCSNQTIANSNQSANEVSIMKLLTPLALTSLFNMMFPALNKKLFEALSSPKITIDAATEVCEGKTTIVTVSVCCTSCTDLTSVEVDYEITGVSASDISVPLKGKIPVNSSGVGTLPITIINDGQTEGDEVLKFTANGVSKEITIHDNRSYTVVPAATEITEGGSTTVTITTVGIPDGTSKPFTITGSGLSQLSGTPTSGSVTINSNTATIDITTKDIDAIADTNLTINFDPGTYYCTSSSTGILIKHTGTPPPVPPADTNCTWIAVPTAWCGTFDGTTGDLKTVFPVGTINVLAAIPGKPSTTVPLTAGVSGGNITILSTAAIDTSSGKPGIIANVLTSFNPPTAGVKMITGSTIQVVGY